MIQIPMKTKGAVDRDTLMSINRWYKEQQPVTAQNIAVLNTRGNSGAGRETPAGSRPAAGGRVPASASIIQAAPPQMVQPPLRHPVQKGQKVPLSSAETVRKADICLGWNSSDARCDVDVSAFLLGADGKVIGDSWFVFYGQTVSPDGSTSFQEDGATDREVIHLDFSRLNPAVKKIVFVLTINEALEKNLNFGMLKDAYIRILNKAGGTELVSFRMTDYYTNVISMMIGEIYLHNGTWKFHAVGNGVARDLAGLCELYGVQVSN